MQNMLRGLCTSDPSRPPILCLGKKPKLSVVFGGVILSYPRVWVGATTFWYFDYKGSICFESRLFLKQKQKRKTHFCAI